jgi:hypothetical protein
VIDHAAAALATARPRSGAGRAWPVVERPTLRYHPRLPNELVLALMARGLPVPRR